MLGVRAFEMGALNAVGVLIVEDDEDARALLAEFLMHQGFHSIMAANGREALARLAYVRPDIVVTDLEMPVMNGVDLIRGLVQIPEATTIPVVVLTSFEDEDARRTLSDVMSQVRVILRKPVGLDALLNAISSCLDQGTKR